MTRRSTMFKEACEILGKQVRPIFVGTRHAGQPARLAVGASILVNDQGWVLTAGHVVKAALQAVEAQQKYDRLSERQKRKQIEERPGTITHAGVRWGLWDEPSVIDPAFLHEVADLALFRLSGFTTPHGYRPAVFREDVVPGESVCRIGYALLDDISIASEGNSLHFDQRPPLFVNDGIVTRYVDISDGECDYRHIEVSSPGLAGQSGGPVADRNAYICGVQVSTRHYRLGFGGDNATHHIGQAVNADVVCKFLRDHDVDHKTRVQGDER